MEIRRYAVHEIFGEFVTCARCHSGRYLRKKEGERDAMYECQYCGDRVSYKFRKEPANAISFKVTG